MLSAYLFINFFSFPPKIQSPSLKSKSALCSERSLYTQLPFITFTSKLKSFYFHSCSVCTSGKLFILSLARISPLYERIITGDG